MENYKFCAFIDILGFKNKIASNFEEAKQFYCRFMNHLKTIDNCLLEMRKGDPILSAKQSDIEFAIFSDSVIIYGQDFKDLLFRLSNITSWLNSFGYFFRGGIGYGKHFSDISPTNYFIVSEGLVQAAVIESQKAIFPRIVIDEIALNTILSDNNINYHTLAHYFIQDKNNLWFINPFFLNPDITDVYELTLKNIEKNEDPRIKEKYIWFKDICEYFDDKYIIRNTPHLYYSAENMSHNKTNLFFYPAVFSLYQMGDKYNYKMDLEIYKKNFSENIANIMEQYNHLSQQPNIFDDLRNGKKIKESV